MKCSRRAYCCSQTPYVCSRRPFLCLRKHYVRSREPYFCSRRAHMCSRRPYLCLRRPYVCSRRTYFCSRRICLCLPRADFYSLTNNKMKAQSTCSISGGTAKQTADRTPDRIDDRCNALLGRCSVQRTCAHTRSDGRSHTHTQTPSLTLRVWGAARPPIMQEDRRSDRRPMKWIAGQTFGRTNNVLR